VTPCLLGKPFLFGEIGEGEMAFNEAGRIEEAKWRTLPSRFRSVVLDVHQMMPKHFHGIIVIPGPGLEGPWPGRQGCP
jgi:hypothetical protein